VDAALQTGALSIIALYLRRIAGAPSRGFALTPAGRKQNGEISGRREKMMAAWRAGIRRTIPVIAVRHLRYRAVESYWQACFSRHFGPGPRM
jgi:hypothetical protein